MVRVVVVGAPRSGKSTYARELRAQGVPTFCGDPRSLVKDPEDGVTYLPEGLPWGGDEGASRYIADHWFTMPGPFCCEGVAMARALRKVVQDNRVRILDGVRIVRFTGQHAHAVTKPGQVTMRKAIDTVWSQIAGDLKHLTEMR